MSRYSIRSTPLRTVAEELQQERPFTSLEEELMVSLMRTASVLEELFAQTLKPFAISLSQYNVLRILRGAGATGRTCGEIGERLISREPDVTRLLERMEKSGLILRTRSTDDRRVVRTRITPEALDLLAKIDDELLSFNGLLQPLGTRAIEATLKTLDAVRARLRQKKAA